MANAGLIYAVAAALTWGLVYTLDQRVLKETSPFTLVFITAVITAIILLPMAFFQRESILSLSGVSGKMWGLLFLSLILGILANFFIFSSIKILDASTASIFEIAYPFFVVLFSFLIYRTVPNIYFFIGAFLIFVGAAIIIATSS